MADDIAAVWQSGCFQLQQLGSIRQSLTLVAGNMLVHAFISSRLDYCNQLFVGVSGRLLDKLQSLQNATAHLVTEARKVDHMTPVMREVHWLPVWHRLRFRTAVLMFKYLYGVAWVYLSEYLYCKPTTDNTGHLHLWQASMCLLSVPRTQVTINGFSVSGPAMWNSLPVLCFIDLKVKLYYYRISSNGSPWLLFVQMIWYLAFDPHLLSTRNHVVMLQNAAVLLITRVRKWTSICTYYLEWTPGLYLTPGLY